MRRGSLAVFVLELRLWEAAGSAHAAFAALQTEIPANMSRSRGESSSWSRSELEQKWTDFRPEAADGGGVPRARSRQECGHVLTACERAHLQSVTNVRMESRILLVYIQTPPPVRNKWGNKCLYFSDCFSSDFLFAL